MSSFFNTNPIKDQPFSSKP